MLGRSRRPDPVCNRCGVRPGTVGYHTLDSEGRLRSERLCRNCFEPLEQAAERERATARAEFERRRAEGTLPPPGSPPLCDQCGEREAVLFTTTLDEGERPTFERLCEVCGRPQLEAGKRMERDRRRERLVMLLILGLAIALVASLLYAWLR